MLFLVLYSQEVLKPLGEKTVIKVYIAEEPPPLVQGALTISLFSVIM